MTYFRDLTPCNYGASFSGLTHLVAVGWLEPPFDFPRGVVKRAMRDRLQALCGSTNILIPGRDVVYVTPELILHYIDEHHYCPPSAFARAVGVCPPMQSKGYFLALMTTGGTMPAFIEESDSNAARQAVSSWQNPLWRAWHRLVRSLATGPRVLRGPLLKEWAAEREARKANEFTRRRVVDFLQRVSNAGHAVHALLARELGHRTKLLTYAERADVESRRIGRRLDPEARYGI